MQRSLGRGGLVWEGRSQECPFVGSPRLQNWTPRKSHTYTDAAHHNDDDVDDKDGVVDDHLAHVGSGEPVVGVEYVQCPVLLESVVVSRVEQVQLVLEQLPDNLKISW